jgi:hypothetical protein
MAAMPSPRPEKPSPLALVPRTLTDSGGSPSRAPSRARISADRGAIFGVSANHDRVDVPDLPSLLSREPRRVLDEPGAVGALPGRVAIGEVLADRSQARGSQNRRP